ncbi:class I SAM-dependent methyltransferase [Pseudotenacibaculum sp. MALMAid0570]|uniref:THUMP-like domain-containing protein n=1 Tax=Pseudotenacibaculum sp. MALMAid0570 TaxID=3143938 RepID=UPI0032DF0A1C
MNERILHKDVQDFIQQNLKSNIAQLVLKGSPFEDVSIQEIANQIVSKQKSEKKLPTWFQTEGIFFPPKLNLEQTSSEITAAYKSRLIKGESLIDITGGFGVDSYAFSKHFQEVNHCEINEELSKIAAYNFKKLGVSNVQFTTENGLDIVKNSTKAFDCIYADPSRRSNHKGKVFLLDDCEPNIPENIDLLLQKANHILLKVSPILDITSAINELKNVKEVHVVAVNNEVKELLFLLERSYEDSIKIKTTNFQRNNQQEFEFILGTNEHSNYSNPKEFLYEPNAAIMKSGGFHKITSSFNVYKLHQNSHLFTSNEHIEFPGRVFKIIKILPYDKKKMKKQLSLKKANITTRNFSKSVDEIRKELKIKDGGIDYLFFTTESSNKQVCIHCKKS